MQTDAVLTSKGKHPQKQSKRARDNFFTLNWQWPVRQLAVARAKHMRSSSMQSSTTFAKGPKPSSSPSPLPLPCLPLPCLPLPPLPFLLSKDTPTNQRNVILPQSNPSLARLTAIAMTRTTNSHRFNWNEHPWTRHLESMQQRLSGSTDEIYDMTCDCGFQSASDYCSLEAILAHGIWLGCVSVPPSAPHIQSSQWRQEKKWTDGLADWKTN